MPRDPYDVLGVSKSASAGEIQKAYRKLSKKYHPDRNPGDKQADASYKDVQEAYEILNDATKKANYDRFGFAGPPQAGFPGGFSGGGFPGGAGGGTIDPETAEELFKHFMGGSVSGAGPDLSEFFGGGRRKGRARSRRANPEPVEAEVTVPFEVASNGGSVAIDVGGRHIDVRVPAGIEDGKRLRVPAEATGSSDVLLRVRIAPHPYFRREGNDILLDVPISLAEAVLGGKVEVPTVGGERLEVKVRPGTSSGSRLRLRGKGIRDGDQYLIFKVMVPAGEVDEKSRALIEDFVKRHPQHPREHTVGMSSLFAMNEIRPKLTFPPSRRLKTPADFDRCFKRKRSVSDTVLIVYACENGLDYPRLGCSVSRKVGNAVARNRYKRLFREAFRQSQHEMPPGVDLILIPRPGGEPTLAMVKESLMKLAKQAARKLAPANSPELDTKSIE